MSGGNKTISLIAAMATNRAIGLNGEMPWHLPDELQHFKKTTMGKPIVMGRKTWESIGRPLPGRQNIVLSRKPNFLATGCDVVSSFDQALAVAIGDEVMVIGGGAIYKQAMPAANRMIMTLIEAELEGDTWFPAWDPSEWKTRHRRFVKADERNPYSYEVWDMVRT